MEDDDLRAGRLGDARGMVEHPHSHIELLATFGMAHEARDRCVNGEDDARVACKLTELLGPRIVHPELPLEIDLAGRVAPLLQERDRLLGALPSRHAGRAVVELGHVPSVLHGMLSDPVSTLIPWSKSRHGSISWSSISISGSPTSGGKPGRSRNGIWTSWRPSCGLPTERATATR